MGEPKLSDGLIVFLCLILYMAGEFIDAILPIVLGGLILGGLIFIMWIMFDIFQN